MDNSMLKISSYNETQSIKKRKILIEDVVTKDVEKAEPCLVQFSNGVIKNMEQVNGKLYRNASEKYIRKKKDRMLKVSTPHLTYVGKNFGEGAVTECRERFFLGVLDENTNKMRLVEMSSFLLHPEIKTASTVFSDQSTDPSSYKLRQQTLMENFGGKKGRAINRKRAQGECIIEDMSEALHEAIVTIEPKDGENEEEDSSQSYANILPECNRNAYTVVDVYSLSSIISDHLLVTFNTAALECLDGNCNQSNYSVLFNQTVANVKLSAEEEEFQAKKVCVALFTEKLIQLLRKDWSDKNPLHPCPMIVQTKIFATFTEGKKRIRTKLMQHKLVTHIIILALLVNNYEVPFVTLNRAVGISKERLENFIRVVGATYVRDAGNVVLKLPLLKVHLPRPKNMKLKQKR